MLQHGPYVYDTPGDIAQKTFISEDGAGTRTFTAQAQESRATRC